jgi:hypothetical protein
VSFPPPTTGKIRSPDFRFLGVSLQSGISVVRCASHGVLPNTNLAAHPEAKRPAHLSPKYRAAHPFPSVIFLISDQIGGLVGGLCSSSPRCSGVQMLLPVAGHRDNIPLLSHRPRERRNSLNVNVVMWTCLGTG